MTARIFRAPAPKPPPSRPKRAQSKPKFRAAISQSNRNSKRVRDMLRQEGERVTQKISGFASLTHAASTAMTVIADSLAQWKTGAARHQPAR